ncbi:MAG TPA: type II toxin-antitoxin system RelE/ParE family toxin [Pyrinomonadaceae bacterium]|nr:type II toxin-antitoxin system RelE/ParE family toxin [Pyrinomonadaceae bacterium]
MVEIVWTHAALSDLDAIAEYIALENPAAAKRLVRKVFHHVEHPRSGSKIRELKGWRYRQIIEPPCRIFYRQEDTSVYILYVMREERLLRGGILKSRVKQIKG